MEICVLQPCSGGSGRLDHANLVHIELFHHAAAVGRHAEKHHVLHIGQGPAPAGQGQGPQQRDLPRQRINAGLDQGAIERDALRGELFDKDGNLRV